MLKSSRTSTPNMISLGFVGALAMAAAMGFGRFSYTPILPGMMADLGLSAADAGLIAAGNFTGYLAGAVLAAYSWASGRERQVAVLALLANAMLLLAMALFDAVPAFVVIRFLAGLASAFAMIFTSSIVLGHAALRGNENVQPAHFGGVGLGIALSSFMVVALATLFDGAQQWRWDWIFGGAFAAVAALVAWVMLPRAPQVAGEQHKEQPLVWKRPLLLLTLSYGLFGFGYVVTATFLVAMARSGSGSHVVEFLSWFITGLAAAASLLAWRPFQRRFGLGAAYMAGLLTESVGVLATVLLPAGSAPLIGGLLFGATFLMITAYGLQIGRRLSPESPRRAFAIMTAAFGIGQIIGPLVAGWLAEATGSFALPTLVAAGVLVVCALLVWPVRVTIR
ncbi:YbfB/YjiJ family MFS transporter [Rhizobium sp. LjRoot30]|uniref:YbfB/YjiJ family MFS transporter n=1 Tax=Rhizobium sp. LjRoot30 TaxID=3342320 RepID=UPI003ECDF06B